MTNDPAWPLTEHVCRTGYADLPASTIQSARRDILDTFGCMLGGSGSPGIDQLCAVIGHWGGREESRVLLRGTSLPAAAAAPNTPIAAVRCQPRSNVLAKAMRHDTSSPSATASRRSRPLTPPSRSATARTAASTETPGWIEPPASKVSSKSSAWPMLAFSSAA